MRLSQDGAALAFLGAGAGALALAGVLAACGTRAAHDFSVGDDAASGAGNDGPTGGDDAQPSPGEGVDASLRLQDAAPADARYGDGGACSFGSAASIATSANLNLFGQIVYYEDGGAFPSGRYRARYADGCMKYDYLQGWTVQGDGPDAAGGFWFVGATTTDLIAKPPGTVGVFAGAGAYSTFDDCVDANLSLDQPLEFDFDGGPIGVWLDDNPYLDNVAGDNGRNPAWNLVLLQACPPNLGVPVPQ
jgi:hypothetical protein